MRITRFCNQISHHQVVDMSSRLYQKDEANDGNNRKLCGHACNHHHSYYRRRFCRLKSLLLTHKKRERLVDVPAFLVFWFVGSTQTPGVLQLRGQLRRGDFRNAPRQTIGAAEGRSRAERSSSINETPRLHGTFAELVMTQVRVPYSGSKAPPREFCELMIARAAGRGSDPGAP